VREKTVVGSWNMASKEVEEMEGLELGKEVGGS
jgi:hypothetical protein